MRILIVPALLATLLCQIANSQAVYKQEVDSFLYHINKSDITTGILYDRVMPVAGLPVFNTLHGNPDTSTFKRFRQGYREIYQAAYTPTSLLHENYIDSFRMASNAPGIPILIGIMNFNFNLIDTLAVENNLVYWGTDSLLRDVQPRSTHPFWTKNVVMASIMSDYVDSSSSNTYSFRFDSLLYLRNTGESITALQVDFGNGNVSMSMNQAVSVTYGTTGEKIIKFTITFTGNRQIITYAKVKVGPPDGSANRPSRPDKPPVIPEYTITATRGMAAYENLGPEDNGIDVKYNKGVVGVYNRFISGVPATNIVKPIIILDGFDPLDERRIPEIYGTYLGYGSGSSNLGDELRNMGYDVIILNFPDITNRTVNILNFYIDVPEFRQAGQII